MSIGSDWEYYDQMRYLAREKRAEYSLSTTDIGLSTIRMIYERERITIDKWPRKWRKLKAAYFCDIYGCHVLLNMKLPDEPRLFAMVHELKHHYLDQCLGRCICEDINDSTPRIEKGAEVFAAEFLFPDEEFREHVTGFVSASGICAEDIVHMKYHSPAKVSYTFFQKTLHRLGYIKKGQFDNVKFSILHKNIYGAAYYRRRKS